MGRFKYNASKVNEAVSDLDEAYDILDDLNIEINNGIRIIHSARGSEYLSIDYNPILNYQYTAQEYITSLKKQIREKARQIEEYNDAPWYQKTFATIGMGLGKIVEGFATAGEQIVDGFASLGGMVVGIFDKDAKDAIGGWIEKDHVGDAFDSFYNSTGIEKYSCFSSKSTAANIFKGVGVAAGYVAVAAATGGVGAAIGGGSMAAGAGAAMTNIALNATIAGVGGLGSGTERGLQQGKTYNEAFVGGVKQGAIQAATVVVAGKIGEKLAGVKTTPVTESLPAGAEALALPGATTNALAASSDDVINAATKVVANTGDDVINGASKLATGAGNDYWIAGETLANNGAKNAIIVGTDGVALQNPVGAALSTVDDVVNAGATTSSTVFNTAVNSADDVISGTTKAAANSVDDVISGATNAAANSADDVIDGAAKVASGAADDVVDDTLNASYKILDENGKTIGYGTTGSASASQKAAAAIKNGGLGMKNAAVRGIKNIGTKIGNKIPTPIKKVSANVAYTSKEIFNGATTAIATEPVARATATAYAGIGLSDQLRNSVNSSNNYNIAFGDISDVGTKDLQTPIDYVVDNENDSDTNNSSTESSSGATNSKEIFNATGTNNGNTSSGSSQPSNVDTIGSNNLVDSSNNSQSSSINTVNSNDSAAVNFDNPDLIVNDTNGGVESSNVSNIINENNSSDISKTENMYGIPRSSRNPEVLNNNEIYKDEVVKNVVNEKNIINEKNIVNETNVIHETVKDTTPSVTNANSNYSNTSNAKTATVSSANKSSEITGTINKKAEPVTSNFKVESTPNTSSQITNPVVNNTPKTSSTNTTQTVSQQKTSSPGKAILGTALGLGAVGAAAGVGYKVYKSYTDNNSSNDSENDDTDESYE